MLKKTICSFIILSFALSANVNASNPTAGDCKCSYADLVAPLLPAVVNISTSKKITQAERGRMPAFPPGSPLEEFNQFFERFGMLPPDSDEEDSEEGELKPLSAGSGFIINKDGYIVTNHHVIADAEKITVKLHDDKKFDAKLIGFDTRTDIALIKIESKEPVSFVNFGNADEIRVGDPIIAIGNPFGLGGTVTTGIISSRAREINAGATSLVDNFIQTDAAINKGNSGGPMFNIKGEVIGINTAIYSPSGGNVGIGFAVPSSIAEPVVMQLQKTGKVNRGWLGVTIQPTEGVTEGIGIKDNKGALVVDIAEGSSAEKAGINIGDVILKFDGKEISSNKKLSKIVAETPVGKNVEVELMSQGKPRTVSLKLGELDDNSSKASSKKDKNLSADGQKTEMFGLGVTNLTQKLRQKFRLQDNLKGVLVLSVKPHTDASRSGIKASDIIVAVNQEQAASVEDLKRLLEDAKKTKKPAVMLWIKRNNMNIFLQLNIKK